MKEKSPKPGFHLGAPVTMAVAIVLGAAFAVGHYFFYRQLNGRPTPDSGYQVWGESYRVSGQQVNIAVGTLFAVLVKTCLGYATATGIDQVAWKKVRAQETQVGVVDDLLSVSTRVLSLLQPRLWLRYPLIAISGAVLWLLPVASIITPATLTVRSVADISTRMMRVPRVDFTSPNIVEFSYGDGYMFGYDKPQLEVQRIAEAIASGGGILSISPPFPNSSWHLDFHGPSLKCGNANETARGEILEDVKANTNCSGGNVYGYLSWTPLSPVYSGPHATDGPDSFLPFDSEGELQLDTLGPKSGYGPLKLFMAILPAMLKRTYVDNYSDDDNCPPVDVFVENATILECSLRNVSYAVDFTFVNGAQSVSIAEDRFLNDSPYQNLLFREDFDRTNGAYDPGMLELTAYEAIMDAFNRLVVGAISNAQYRSGGTSWGPPSVTHRFETRDTTIMSTILASSTELEFMIHEIENQGRPTPPGLSAAYTKRSLVENIEDMFRNITISLLDSNLLQANYSSPTGPPLTSVTLTTQRNIYIFSWSMLWVAYGVAILCALVVAALGLFAYFSNRGSYSTKFSTVLRTTRGAFLSSSLASVDTSGKDPLPEYIADSTIDIARSQAEDSAGGRQQQRYHYLSESDSD